MLDRILLRQLFQMLHGCNPYIRLYKTARERLAEANQATTGPFRMLISPQIRLVMESGADRRHENLPTASKVAVILPDKVDSSGPRDLILIVRDPVYNRPRLR